MVERDEMFDSDSIPYTKIEESSGLVYTIKSRHLCCK